MCGGKRGPEPTSQICYIGNPHPQGVDTITLRGAATTIVDVSPVCEHVFVAVTTFEVRLTSARDLRGLQLELGMLARSFDPDAVRLQDAPGLFAEAVAVERWATTIKTLTARRMEDTATWKQAGYRSAAEQLAATSGTSVSSARNLLETSKQLEALPATANALRAGKLSAAKVEAIAPVAVVREACLQVKSVDRDAAHARIRERRFAREWTDGEGAWNFRARGTADDGARFRAAFDPIVDELFKTARDESRREPYEAYAFDAFIEMARRATGGEGAGTTKTSPRFMALIRVDLEALRRGAVEDGEVCEIAGLHTRSHAQDPLRMGTQRRHRQTTVRATR